MSIYEDFLTSIEALRVTPENEIYISLLKQTIQQHVKPESKKISVLADKIKQLGMLSSLRARLPEGVLFDDIDQRIDRLMRGIQQLKAECGRHDIILNAPLFLKRLTSLEAACAKHQFVALSRCIVDIMARLTQATDLKLVYAIG